MRSTRDVIIQSERFDEAVMFYRDVLGFEQTVDEDRLIGFETGSFQLYVEPGRSRALFLRSSAMTSRLQSSASYNTAVESSTKIGRSLAATYATRTASRLT